MHATLRKISLVNLLNSINLSIVLFYSKKLIFPRGNDFFSFNQNIPNSITPHRVNFENLSKRKLKNKRSSMLEINNLKKNVTEKTNRKARNLPCHDTKEEKKKKKKTLIKQKASKHNSKLRQHHE